MAFCLEFGAFRTPFRYVCIGMDIEVAYVFWLIQKSEWPNRFCFGSGAGWKGFLQYDWEALFELATG